MMESPKFVSMARGSDATSSMVDQLSKAFEQMQFQQNYTKLAAVKPNWYNNVSDCSGRQKALIEKLRGADERLQSIIATGKLQANWDQYNAIRKRIKEVFAELLRHEMKFCRQNNVEQHFWKLLYHNSIESARRLASDKSNNDTAIKDSYRQFCLHVIDDGTQLFQDILLLLTQTYGFQLEQFMGVESGKNLKGLKYISLAMVSAQKCCICLGDLMRYRELVNETNKFDQASEWYTKAYQLIPSNGMPSNQLAIIALYSKKKFDAIFYHMRSLNASNPIKSAKESLVILFDELRKKYQSLNKNQTRNRASTETKVKMKNFKREIWVHPTDGQLNYRTVFLDQESESLDSADLYKKFIFNFSHLHGILFTKVGSDSLEICMEQTLKQFQELLNYSTSTSCILTLQKMAQMIILNINSIEASMQLSSSSHLQTQSQSQLDSDSQPMSALVFSFAFAGIILNKLQCEIVDMNMLATAESGDTTYESKCRINGETHFNVRQINKFKISDSINNSLAAISLWCNWLKFNWSAWTSDAMLAAVHKFNESYGICIWDDFARITMALDKFNFEIDDQLLVRSEPLRNTSTHKRIRLTEDMITLGMSSVIRNDFVYCKIECDERNALTILRLKNIHDFCTTDLMKDECLFLCRLDFGEVIVAQLFSETDELGSFDESRGHSEDVKEVVDRSSNDIQQYDTDKFDENICSNEEPNEHQSNATSSTDEIQKLLQRKTELEQTHQMQEKLNKFTQDIIRKTDLETITLEIRPKYLLPDTNCFIDFLPQIKQLSQLYPLYNVIVPIVVLNELEGLAKGDENGLKVYGTPTKTSFNAHKALVFLKASGSNVKCATTKGSFLNSMTFTNESDFTNASSDSPIDHLNNDDKILLTAINLTKIHSNDAITGSKLISMSNLQRKVVLLTNDRNLKLKAITQNIPVRELVDFIKWNGTTK